MAENEQKRAPGGNPALFLFADFKRPLAVAMIVAYIGVAALVAASIVSFFVRADPWLNEVDRYITAASNGGLDGEYDLIPSVFYAGQSLLEVKAALSAAGYRPFLGEKTVGVGPAAPADPNYYSKDGGMGPTSLICSISRKVILEADEQGALQSAIAHIGSACL